MGFDEKFFAFSHRLFKKLTAPPPPAHYEQRADLKDLEPRLHIISKSLCRESIHILEAERMGGFASNHFYFPRSLCPFACKEFNELLYIQRTLFYCSAKQLGFCLPPENLSNLEKKTYTCLAIYQIYQFIELEFPGSLQVLEKLSEQTKAELNSLPAQQKNTQNGILADWIYTTLTKNYANSPWKHLLCKNHKNTFAFWKFAKAVYQDCFAKLPEGPELADEAFILWGFLMPPALEMGGFQETNDDINSEALARGTEVQGKDREDVVKVNLEKAKEESNPVFHSFEKVETLEEYQGGMRTEDGDDNLQDHSEALEELKISEVTRSRERTLSIFKADIRLNNVAPDLICESPTQGAASEILFYPEWDFKKKSYLEEWCRLEVYRPAKGAVHVLGQSYHKERKDILKVFDQIRHKPLWQKRQRDGVDLDIDAVVNRFADLSGGYSSDDRLYLRNKKQKKNWQCVLLLDNSLSSDSWVANQRILDVIKDSVNIVSDALAQDPETIAVSAFHSNTRHHCSYELLKDFSESWDAMRRRLSGLEPAGYTRIGPALRHALHTLRKSSARHKFIFLLSDGKASDYDHYEGRYGMEDIKQALREARRENVHIKCLAVEENAKFYLPQMFGAANIRILPSPRKLPKALTELFANLLK